ncbi:MAG: acetylornithine transaminase [Abditibacteriales bacterium]|nr:acetylornithine transaminase [Abditibacteriales bacterium]MDW8364725.1 acetylornithine transaminase [Abditibacteriales bacterium]
MTLSDIIAKTDAYLIKTYSRSPAVAFVRGQGARLWDTDGKEYLDFLGGIAVVAVGHCHPKVTAAIQQQAATLVHTSNLYHIAPQALLAEKLFHLSGGYQSFFCNSGAEANEGAFKLARKHAKLTRGEGKYEIISTLGSFHGRTLMALTATGQTKYQQGFEPLAPGFKHVPFNDLDALRHAVTEHTCAIILEPIQGESGIHPCTPEYLQGAAALCREKGLLLILDEVQTEIARTGKMWAHEHYGVQPDIITLAKSLGNGVPIGALLAKPEVAASFQPGDHASTFGGNFLACAAALATLEVIEEENLVENAAKVGDYFMARLRETDGIAEVRGMGLMIGAQFTQPKAREIQNACIANGLLVNAIGDSVIRFEPPLNITTADVDEAMEILRKSMGHR